MCRFNPSHYTKLFFLIRLGVSNQSSSCGPSVVVPDASDSSSFSDENQKHEEITTHNVTEITIHHVKYLQSHMFPFKINIIVNLNQNAPKKSVITVWFVSMRK